MSCEQEMISVKLRMIIPCPKGYVLGVVWDFWTPAAQPAPDFFADVAPNIPLLIPLNQHKILNQHPIISIAILFFTLNGNIYTHTCLPLPCKELL